MNQMELIQNAVLSVKESDIKNQKGCAYPIGICKTAQIKDKQLKGIQTFIAPGCKAGDVAVLVDLTLFGSAKEGIVFALDGLYASKGYLSDGPFKPPVIPLPVRYETLLGAEIAADNPSYLTLRWKDGSSKVVHASIYSKFLVLALNAVINALDEEQKQLHDQARQAVDSEDDTQAQQAVDSEDDTQTQQALDSEDDTQALERVRLFNEGFAAYEGGRTQEAEQLWLQAAELGVADAMQNLALLYAGREEFDLAEDWAKKAVAAHCSGKDTLLDTLAQSRTESQARAEQQRKEELRQGRIKLLHTAMDAQKAGDTAGMVAALEALLSESGSEYTQDAKLVMNLAVGFAKLEQYDKAEQWALRAKELGHEKAEGLLTQVRREQELAKFGPELVKAYRDGMKAAQEERFEEAVELLKQAAKAGVPGAAFYTALAFCNLEQFKEALPWAAQAKRMGDEKAGGLLEKILTSLEHRKQTGIETFNAGVDAMDAGRYDEAEQLFLKALELDVKGSASALARLFLHQERYDQALEWAQKAIELNEEDAEELLQGIQLRAKATPEAIEALLAGNDAYKKDDKEQAIQLWKQAAQGGVDDACWNLAVVLKELERKSEALEWAKKAWESGEKRAAQLAGTLQRDIALEQAAPAVRAVYSAGQRAMEAERFAAAEQLFRQAFEEGLMEAAYDVAMALDGQEEDGLLTWLDMAAQAGDLRAIDLLDGIQADADERTAVEELVNAGCDAYEAGDIEQAIPLWKQAAELGDVNALYNIALALRNQKKLNEAEKWAKKAMDAGYVYAENLLWDIQCQKYVDTGNAADKMGDREMALKMWMQAAELGSAPAMCNIAMAKAAQKNYEEAGKWAEKARDAGAENADELLQRIRRDKYFYAGCEAIEAKDPDRAIQLWKQAAQLGAVNALYNIALTLFEQDELDEAEQWAQKAREAGEEEADSLLRRINGDRFFAEANAAYHAGDQHKAIELWKKAAESGNSAALYNIAQALASQLEWDEAEQWAQKAWEAGEEKAEGLLHVIQSIQYHNAGVDADNAGDRDKAIELWKKAAKYGNHLSMHNIALKLVKQNELDEAEQWAQKAREAGDEMADDLLQTITRLKTPGEKDFQAGSSAYEEGNYDAALSHWQQAAELGHRTATDNIGVLYHHGFGVKRDRNEALRWYIKAYEAGAASGAYHASYWFKECADEHLLKTFGPSGEQRNWLVKAAELGHQKAMEELKSFKKNGMITNVHQCLEDYKAGRYLACAEAWLAMAEKDDVHAKRCLALLYHQGLGVTQDKEEADRWFQATAKDANSPYHTHQEQQWPQLLVETAKALNNCIDPPERKAFATVLCLQAAELGSPEGARYAAEGLVNKQDGPMDLKLAIHWAERALHLGAPGADHAMTVVREKLGLEEYEKGRSLCDSGNYKEAEQWLWKAAAKFKLKHLLDSDKLHGFGLRSKVTHQTDTIQPMDTIELGRFKQTKDGQYLPIRWLVLARDKRRALVISRDALEVMPYYKYSLSYLTNGVSWHNCDPRRWLNGDFINEAFTVDERKYLWPVVTEKEHPNVKDLVFLLSTEEAKQYFGKYASHDSNLYPDFTAYARRDRGAYFSLSASFSPSHCWLRASAATPRLVIGLGNAPVVGTEINSVSGEHVDHENGVRPAMWIVL